MSKAFFTTKESSISLAASEEEIQKEQFEYQNRFGALPSRIQTEILVYLRKVADSLLAYNTLLLHGSAIGFRDFAYLFSAKSGTGKTTHTLKWIHNLHGSFVINGDKTFIQFRDDGGVYACGSPWAGKENMCSNTSELLKSIILMERSEDNNIERIPFTEAFPALLQQVYRPDDEEKMRLTLRLLKRLDGLVTFWRFKCNNFKDDCFEIAYNTLVRDQK